MKAVYNSDRALTWIEIEASQEKAVELLRELWVQIDSSMEWATSEFFLQEQTDRMLEFRTRYDGTNVYIYSHPHDSSLDNSQALPGVLIEHLKKVVNLDDVEI